MKRVLFAITMNALLLGASVATLSRPALAQEEGKGTINQRRENQQDRIGEGVENGTLTPKETARLEHKQSALNKEIRTERKEGPLTPKDRRQINRQQNQLSRGIYRTKHDGPHK